MSLMSTRKQELELEIAKLETTLSGLKGQRQKEIEAEQHDAIDNLNVYLEQTDHKFADLKVFLVMVLAEMRALFLGGPTKDTGHMKL